MTTAADTGANGDGRSPDAAAAGRFDALPRCPSPWTHPVRAAGWLLTVGAGLASLALLLAILAAIPVVNLLALGTMLEAEGRVVRSGRLRDGIPFAGALPRLGSVVIGIWLWLLVVRFVSQAAADAMLVDPGGPVARRWEIARAVTAVAVALHVSAALYAGGSLGSFVRPFRNARRLWTSLRRGTAWRTAATTLRELVEAIAPGRLAWLGLQGFAGALLWLLPPTMLFSALHDTTRPVEVIIALVGAILLGVVLSWAPFLQARFSAERRFAAFRDVATVRELWRRAPVAMLLALVVLYGLSLPLSLLTIVATPRDAMLLLTPLFILTIFPARMAVGWATHFASARPRRRPLVVRWSATLVLVPLMAIYLFLLFLTPAIDAVGRRALFDHHALLLPTPF